ncbi:MAG: MarR family transcriptional regulator [Chloroflexota bacterium]
MQLPTAQPQPTSPVSVARPARRRPDRAVVAWLRLARVFQKVNRATSEALRAEGLSLGQFDVLVQIGSAEGATQQQVADALLVTKSNVCQLLDRLERAGLVERRQHGRSNLLFLTADGRQLYDHVVPAHERQIAGLLSSLGPDDRSQLLGLLRKLDRALT